MGIFTVLIVIVFLLIYALNYKSKQNKWCFITGLMFSVGTLKEFLYYELCTLGTFRIPEIVYSILSAIFYYYAIPCGVIFAMYFSKIDEEYPEKFFKIQLLSFLPAIIMSIIFPVMNTAQLQSVNYYCIIVGVYNWLYGIIITVLIARKLKFNRFSVNYAQYLYITLTVLIPLWFWLVLAFPYHALGINLPKDMWKYNVIIMLIVLVYLVVKLFKDGIWGVRFVSERYNWDNEEIALQKNARYVSHAIKNDLAKIKWSTDLIDKNKQNEQQIKIIYESIAHLEKFLNRTNFYSDKIELNLDYVDISEIFQNIIDTTKFSENKQLNLYIKECSQEKLYCDSVHINEVLLNLIYNSAEAITSKGDIALSYISNKKYSIISVEDTGCGIDTKNIKNLYQPYFTTKNTNRNLGLGLYYCWNVMCKHNGKITLNSEVGQGSKFSLYFPKKENKKERNGHKNGKNKNSLSGR